MNAKTLPLLIGIPLLFSGCLSPKTSDTTIRPSTPAKQTSLPNGAGKTPTQAQGATPAMGGGDLGGGNGLAGKPLESYRIRLQVRPEFQKHVAPVLEILERKAPMAALELRHILHQRSWYLVPVELKTLPSEVINVAFNTDQLALQTSRSVWINRSLYEKMGEFEQADLLMHELIMGLKILNFTGAEDQCKARRVRATPETDCTLIGRFALPEPLRLLLQDQKVTLTQTDYEQIRFASSELLARSSTLSETEVIEILNPIRAYPNSLETSFIATNRNKEIPIDLLNESLTRTLANQMGLYQSDQPIQRELRAENHCHIALTTETGGTQVALTITPIAKDAATGPATRQPPRVVRFHSNQEKITNRVMTTKAWLEVTYTEQTENAKIGDRRWEMAVSYNLLGVQRVSLYQAQLIANRNFIENDKSPPEWHQVESFSQTQSGFKPQGFMCSAQQKLYRDL